MSDSRKKTILCISSYFEGSDFLVEAHKRGWRVIFITSKSLENVSWPRESIDDLYFMPDIDKEWNMHDLIKAVSYVARTVVIDRIVALDDFDVEKAAALREHLRVPGMGETTMRYFRDKYSMRMKALEKGVLVPEFVHVLNHDMINRFMAKKEPPYILKPRMQAGSIGMKKLESRDHAWEVINALGDEQSALGSDQDKNALSHASASSGHRWDNVNGIVREHARIQPAGQQTRFLESLLARETLYRTALFRNRYEAVARANISRYLAMLRRN